jgi:hypothetical protein
MLRSAILILILVSQTLSAQSPTFGYFSLGTVGGSQSISIPDLNVDLQHPYKMDYTIEGHWFSDDIYYIGKVFNSAYGEYSYESEGASYQVLNGSVVSFSLGSFSESGDRWGFGFGIRNDFTHYGLSNYGGGKVESFSWLLGPEVPITYSLNDYMRLYAKVAVMNVWNDKVFNGFATDSHIDLHITPFSFLLVGGGVGFNTMSTNTDFMALEDDIAYTANALYFQLYIGVSLGHTQAF